MPENVMIIDVEHGESLIIESIDKFGNKTLELFVESNMNDKGLQYQVKIIVEVLTAYENPTKSKEIG